MRVKYVMFIWFYLNLIAENLDCLRVDLALVYLEHDEKFDLGDTDIESTINKTISLLNETIPLKYGTYDLVKKEIENLDFDQALMKLNIYVDSFDFLNLDLSLCVKGLKRFNSSLINLELVFKEKNIRCPQIRVLQDIIFKFLITVSMNK